MKSRYFKAMLCACVIFFAVSITGYSQTQGSQEQTSSLNDTTVTVKVTGITCNGDLAMIADHVKKLNGVTSCKQVGKASAASSFEIKYDPSKTTYLSLVKTVEATPSCDYPDKRPYKVKSKN